jgi:hypothetical protein
LGRLFDPVSPDDDRDEPEVCAEEPDEAPEELLTACGDGALPEAK